MRAGHFVHEVTINVEKRGAIRLYVHHMVPPDLSNRVIGPALAAAMVAPARDAERREFRSEAVLSELDTAGRKALDVNWLHAVAWRCLRTVPGCATKADAVNTHAASSRTRMLAFGGARSRKRYPRVFLFDHLFKIHLFDK